MTKEIKPIPGLKGYWADTEGNIWSSRKNIGGIWKVTDTPHRKLSQQIIIDRDHPMGRPCVYINNADGRKKLTVSRLIAMAFLPNLHNYPNVCHRNDLPTDNRLENLYWGDNKVNCQDRKRNARKDNLLQELEKRIKYLEGLLDANCISY